MGTGCVRTQSNFGEVGGDYWNTASKSGLTRGGMGRNEI
jgi:hypothetical protein